MSSHTKGPWKFEQMDGFDALHKLRGTTPEPHEGYFRTNGGDWSVACAEGRICLVDFKGTAKRGQAYTAPDPEGMANARLISAAPELLEALKAALAWIDAVPKSIALPTMPGFDRDVMDELIAKAEGQ